MPTPSGPLTAKGIQTYADSDSPDLGPLGLGVVLNRIDFMLTGAAILTGPANKAGTSSTTDVMLGLNQSITPRKGKIGDASRLAVAFSCTQTLGGGNPSQLGLRIGTGAPPANGDASTGTAISFPLLVGTINAPIILIGGSTAVLVGTAYWVDVAFSAPLGGSSPVLSNYFLIAAEL